jgi:Asp-tRNA(Asn)/Glu-tRNA(Gln) amidotransferase A subunit family amidase
MSNTAPLGVPVGMDILGKPWSEAKLLSLAYSFEQATHNANMATGRPCRRESAQAVKSCRNISLSFQ